MTSRTATPADPSDDELEILRQSNIGRLLDEVHVGFDQLALSYLKQRGYPMLSASHTHVLRTMRLEGARVTDMAEQAGISKQAMSKLVAAFEQHGFVEWRTNPNDGRSRMVYATPAGRQLLAHGVAALQRAEDEYFGELTADERETLRNLLKLAQENRQRHRWSDWRRRRA